MAEISLRLVDGGMVVEAELAGVSPGAQSELEYALLQAGGSFGGRGIRISAFRFRRDGRGLATLLRRTGAEIKMEAAVEDLLRLQLEEIRARLTAGTDLRLLENTEVEAAVRSTGRFTRTLTDRQIQNLGRLLALRHGANFSVPGAGKTATLLAIFESMRGREGVDRLLVVAPKNAFLSWEQEIAECYRGGQVPRMARLSGGRRRVASALLADDAEILLVTYQLLPNVIDLVRTWAIKHHTHVALDESHRAKAGYAGVYSTAALQLAESSVRRDIMSGTPLPHAPEDLRPQLDFLWPGQRILPELRLLSESPPEIITEVEERLRPLYVRTTKAELNLPPLEVRPVPVRLGPLQRELYEVLRSEAARAAAGMGPRDRRFFRMLGRHVVRLIQVAVNPMLLTQGEVVARNELEPTAQGMRAWELLRELARYEQPIKVAKAVELAEAAIAQGERVLIWTTFVLNLAAMERLLQRHNPVVLFGQVPTGAAEDLDTREGRIRAFHEDQSCRVMIANPAAAGEGISLHHACRYAIYLDRNFNAAHYLQSIDRIHRLGSTRATRVDILEAEGTIDARIAERLRSKINAMAQILNDEGLRALAYDPEDIVEDVEGGIEFDDIEEIVEHLCAAEGAD
jgi:SNF2 family DNA or RNA helicase